MNNEYGALVVERNLFHCYFFHYKSNMNELGNEPGPPKSYRNDHLLLQIAEFKL